MKPVRDFTITFHGIEGESYFQGHGTALTRWEDCATGIGDSQIEAVNDALESLAQNDWDVATLEASEDFKAEIGGLAMMQKEQEERIAGLRTCDEPGCSGNCDVGLWWYVSIDVKGDA